MGMTSLQNIFSLSGQLRMSCQIGAFKGTTVQSVACNICLMMNWHIVNLHRNVFPTEVGFLLRRTETVHH